MSDLIGKLESLRRAHDVVEDCWYSCPKSGECCNDSLDPNTCNCGADRHNTTLDEVIAAIRVMIGERGAKE